MPGLDTWVRTAAITPWDSHCPPFTAALKVANNGNITTVASILFIPLVVYPYFPPLCMGDQENLATGVLLIQPDSDSLFSWKKLGPRTLLPVNPPEHGNLVAAPSSPDTPFPELKIPVGIEPG